MPADFVSPPPQNAARLRVGMVGVGNFGAYRRHTMRDLQCFEILAAYDLNESALADCQAEDGASPVASFEQLLEFPDIEAVFISTGAKYHADQIIAAAERGLHVFVEKPLCATPAELARILECQRATGIIIGCGHEDHASNPVSQRTRRMIETGQLGTIASFQKTSAHSGGLKIQPGDWRGDPHANPGGMLFQCGIHGLHELMYYFGPVAEVTAAMTYNVHSTRTADVATCMLTMESGIVGTLCAYHVTPYLHRLEIFGTEATLAIDERYGSEGVRRYLQRRHHDGGFEERETLHPESESPRGEGSLRSFFQAVREGTEPSPGLTEAARAVAVVFAAEASAREGRTIVLDEMFPDVFAAASAGSRHVAVAA